jgi:hypothetical protein
MVFIRLEAFLAFGAPFLVFLKCCILEKFFTVGEVTLPECNLFILGNITAFFD